MPEDITSLPPGRRSDLLEKKDVERVINTFLSLDNTVNVVYDDTKHTNFHTIKEGEQDIPEIVFGPDVYPAANAINPNQSLLMQAAAAHEICHYHRWKDKTEINDMEHVELDEAFTSLDAFLRFPQLSDHERRQLVADAMQRLAMYAHRKDIK